MNNLLYRFPALFAIYYSTIAQIQPSKAQIDLQLFAR